MKYRILSLWVSTSIRTPPSISVPVAGKDRSAGHRVGVRYSFGDLFAWDVG